MIYTVLFTNDVTGGRFVDVSQNECMSQLHASIGNVKLDLLVNNAGILTEESLDDLNMDRILQQIQVNSLGPLRVTSSLLPNVKDGGKIFIITSRMGSIADNSSGAYYGYRMSKVAVNMAAKSLAIDLEPRGRTIC